MKFKLSYLHCGVIFLFIVVILMSDVVGSTYIPFRKSSLFSQETPYEGFLSDFPDNAKKAAKEGVSESFSLRPASISSGNEKSIDVLSTLPSSYNCVGSSSGYSNSLGGICLTEEVKSLLVTRGKNA